MSLTREICLNERLTSTPVAGHFSTRVRDLGPPSPGEVRVRTSHLAMDPGLRSRFRDDDAPVGRAVTGQAIGKVVSSDDTRFPVGSLVHGRWAWAEVASANTNELAVIEQVQGVTPIDELGLLGWAGHTAYVGIMDVARPLAGETIYISSAAGSVGIIAGQLAKRLGAHVIGSAGSDEKVDLVLAAGFDAAFNYRTESADHALTRLAPSGLDLYFDNVGGDQLQAAFEHMRDRGRIVCCGSVSAYNEAGDATCLKGLRRMVTKRLRISGFVVWDHGGEAQRRASILSLLQAGELIHPSTVYEGLESAPQAFIAMLEGRHAGKTIVAVENTAASHSLSQLSSRT